MQKTFPLFLFYLDFSFFLNKSHLIDLVFCKIFRQTPRVLGRCENPPLWCKVLGIEIVSAKISTVSCLVGVSNKPFVKNKTEIWSIYMRLSTNFLLLGCFPEFEGARVWWYYWNCREREREREITFQSKVACAHFKFHGGFVVLWNAWKFEKNATGKQAEYVMNAWRCWQFASLLCGLFKRAAM
jgi:hypothetical protein